MLDIDTVFSSEDAKLDFQRRNPPAPYWLRFIEPGKYISLAPNPAEDAIPAEQAFRLHASGLAEVVENNGLAFIRLSERGLHQLRQLEALGAFASGGTLLRSVPQG
jgi:hypothetical protein